MVTISASLSTAASRCTTRVGMIATYSAISRASRRSFLASTPRARPDWRSLLGVMRRTDRAAARATRPPHWACFGGRAAPHGGADLGRASDPAGLGPPTGLDAIGGDPQAT